MGAGASVDAGKSLSTSAKKKLWKKVAPKGHMDIDDFLHLPLWIHNPLIVRTLELVLLDDPLTSSASGLEWRHFEKCYAMLSRNRSDEEKLACLFRFYDMDGDNLISPDDVAAFHTLTTGGHYTESTSPFPPLSACAEVSTAMPFTPDAFSKHLPRDEAFLLLNLP